MANQNTTPASGAAPPRRRSLPWLWLATLLASLLFLGWRLYIEVQHSRLQRPLVAAVQADDTARVSRLLAWGADPNTLDRPAEPPESLLALLKSLFRRQQNRAGASIAPSVLVLALASPHQDYALVERLVEAGADVTVPACCTTGESEQPEPPLLYAAAWKDPRAVRLLIAHGANVNARDREGKTAVMSASSGEILDLLLAHGGDINAHASSTWVASNYGKGWTALVDAAQDRNADRFDLFATHGADVNAVSDSGQTALMFAAVKGQTRMAEALIARGADISARDKDGNTPLIDAARWGHADIVLMLLDKGADPRQPTKIGWTPLMAAAYGAKPQIVRLLLAHRADVRAATTDGETALMDAADGGSLECVQLLLQAGADPRLLDRNGNSVLMYGVEDVPTIQAHSESDRYDRHATRHCGSTEVIRLLGRRGASLKARNKAGRTPLLAAVSNYPFRGVKPLLELGADPNERCRGGENDGATALMLACTSYRSDLVRLLLSYGADPNLRDKQGRTVRQLAGDDPIAALLKHARTYRRR